MASVAGALIYPQLEVQTVNRVSASALETRGQDDTDDELLARAIQLSLQSQTPSYPAQGFFAGRGSIAAAAVPTMFSAQLAMPYEEQFRRATEESVRDEQLRQQIRQDEVLARQLQTELNLR